MRWAGSGKGSETGSTHTISDNRRDHGNDVNGQCVNDLCGGVKLRYKAVRIVAGPWPTIDEYGMSEGNQRGMRMGGKSGRSAEGERPARDGAMRQNAVSWSARRQKELGRRERPTI